MDFFGKPFQNPLKVGRQLAPANTLQFFRNTVEPLRDTSGDGSHGIAVTAQRNCRNRQNYAPCGVHCGNMQLFLLFFSVFLEILCSMWYDSNGRRATAITEYL